MTGKLFEASCLVFGRPTWRGPT